MSQIIRIRQEHCLTGEEMKAILSRNNYADLE